MIYKNQLEALRHIFMSRKSELKFFGSTVFFKMSNGKIAEIDLDDDGYAHRYSRIRVQIKNKDSGLVTSNYFVFEDYLARSSTDNSVKNMLYIWDDTRLNQLEWYIVEPVSFIPIVCSIFEYIDMYN
jgi:hypothetical protein